MSAPGGGTSVGEIVAYLRMDRSDWDRDIAAARRQADELGRSNPDIRITSNAVRIIGELRLVDQAANQTNQRVAKSANQAAGGYHAILDSLLLLGPAAIPLAGVLGGALVGLVPTLATAALGIAGITGEMKSGALQGSVYGRDINQLKTEFGDLKAIAAGGILKGVDSALASSGPLFKVFNSDTQIMANQLGDIIASGGPGLLRILNQLNPLFVTFGNLIVRGADELSNWAQSSDGVSHFVSYVQQELPSVMQFLGNLLVLFAHLAQAGAGFGGGVLTALNLIVRALDSLPIGVLQALIPLIVATRVSFLTWRAINSVIASVNKTVGGFRASMTATRADSALTAASVARDRAAEALATARAAATESEAAADAALVQENAARQVSAAAYAEARAIAAAKVQEAEGYADAAAAAEAAAITTAAAADTAAADVAAAGTVARVGWAAMLGPIGALVIGVGLLGATFLGSSHDTDAATQANQNYAESVKQSTDAMNEANLAATAKSLQDAGTLGLLDQIKSANQGLSLSYGDLTLAVNGSQAQFDKVYGSLLKIAGLTKLPDNLNDLQDMDLSKTQISAANVADSLRDLRGNLSKNIDTAKIANQAQKESERLATSGSAANREQAAALGLTGSAYLAAEQAAKKSTDQTKAQIQAWQAASDAASLFQQALDSLAGNDIGLAEAQTNLASTNISVTKSFHDNGKVIDGGTAKAVANQTALQGQARAAQQLAEATGKSTKSGEAAVKSYKDSKKALEDELRAHHDLTPAVQAYINKLYDTRDIQNFISKHPTLFDADTSPAEKKILAITQRIKDAKQGKIPSINLDTAAGMAKLQAMEDRLAALRDKTITVTVNNPDGSSSNTTASGKKTKSPRKTAAGGRIFGPGTGTSDTAGIFALSNGEAVIPAKAVAANGAIVDALIAQGRGMAGGGVVGGQPGITHVGKDWIFNGTRYASLRAAENARTAYAKKNQATLSSTASTAIGNVGSAYSPKFDINAVGIDRIRKQLADAQKTLDEQIAKGLSANAAKKYQAEINRYTKLAQDQLKDLRVKIRGSDLDAVKRSLGGTVDDIRNAVGALITDLRHAGASTGAIKAIQTREATLIADRKALDADETKLAAMKDFRTSIESTLSGATDLSKAGSIGDLLASISGGTSANNQYTGDVAKLDKEAAGNKTLLDFINSQAAQGDTTTLQTLAAGSKGDLTQVSKALGGYNSSLLAGGNAATVAKYGKSIDQQTTSNNQLTAAMNRVEAELKKSKATHVALHMNGDKVGQIVIDSPAFGGAVKHIVDTVSTYHHSKG